jgi:hypothetical protein
MDDIRVGSIPSYDTYGDRQRPDTGGRRRDRQAETEAEPAGEDFFEASGTGQAGEEPVRDYFAPSGQTVPEA